MSAFDEPLTTKKLTKQEKKELRYQRKLKSAWRSKCFEEKAYIIGRLFWPPAYFKNKNGSFDTGFKCIQMRLNEELTQQNEDLKAKLESLTSEHNKLVSEHASYVKTSEAKYAETAAKLAELQAEYDVITEEHASFVSSSEAKYAALFKEYNALQEAQEGIIQENQDLAATNQQLNAEKEQLAAENAKLINDFLNEKNAHLKTKEIMASYERVYNDEVARLRNLIQQYSASASKEIEYLNTKSA